MDKAALRPIVFDILRRNPQTHLHAIENEIRQRSTDYDRGDALLIHEIVWELLVQGVLAPGKNSLNLHLPFVHVTEYGGRCLEEGAILAHDPDGYLARLAENAGKRLSPTVSESARDALLAFHAGLHRASIVLLSRAAEDLIRALEAALSRAPKKGIAPQEGCGRAFERIREALEGQDLPDEVGGELNLQLEGLETLFCLTHSRDGTPRSPAADRDRALAYLLLFPQQCRFVYHLIDRIEPGLATPS